MLGRVCKITVGVTAGLVAAAPLAYAGGTGYDDPGAVKGEHVSHDHDGDWGKDGGHHHGSFKACEFNGGNGDAASLISGGSLANAVAQAPIAGNNIANIANCSDFLNNNGNDNLSHNNIAIGGGLLP